eukprot:TRINITY_DN2915_c0_g1_i1.p1 TRINITY_DN2915_c0_g1~~TRINITY_DN2915_c0_g1_i1.p1  ORF type:complete len:416 (+),score=92.47 TRINITY_DN2915_c0_g1_i1:259-1506(+)
MRNESSFIGLFQQRGVIAAGSVFDRQHLYTWSEGRTSQQLFLVPPGLKRRMRTNSLALTVCVSDRVSVQRLRSSVQSENHHSSPDPCFQRPGGSKVDNEFSVGSRDSSSKAGSSISGTERENQYWKEGQGVEGSSSVTDPNEDPIWLQARREARADADEEPVLASFLSSTILAHFSLERALAFHLGNKLSSSTLLATHLVTLFSDIFSSCPHIGEAVRADLVAVRKRDPACRSYTDCLLNFKGFLACQTHRAAHELWLQGRKALALALQSRVSEVFHVDIHPAASIGKGILFDHATGLVIGETAVIGNNVSILHHVTLGGTGSLGRKRHPTVCDGVLIGAGAVLLGAVTVGEGAKIGAGSIVLIDVPPHTTAVGNPAIILHRKEPKISEGEGEKGSQLLPSETMDHTSVLEDYII